jgi:hypothetical protein
MLHHSDARAHDPPHRRLPHKDPHDHPPPHFHVEAPDFAVKIAIGSWEVLQAVGKPRGLDAVLRWAQGNEALLLQCRQETRSSG